LASIEASNITLALQSSVLPTHPHPTTTIQLV
jgi:hypothetical protein